MHSIKSFATKLLSILLVALMVVSFIPGGILFPEKAEAQMSTGQQTKANFVQVEVGSFHSLALDDEGRVYSWAYADEANTGICGSLRGRPNRTAAPFGNDYNLATQIEWVWDSTTNSYIRMPWITQLSASESTSLALDQYGNIWSWGIYSRGAENVGHPIYTVTAAQAVTLYGATADIAKPLNCYLHTVLRFVPNGKPKIPCGVLPPTDTLT